MAAPKEGGFKMSLGGLKGKVGLKAASVKKEVKRPRFTLGDDEEDDSGKQQEISGWDAAEGGAVDIGGPKEKDTPRVIPALPNRNWRDDARRRQQLAKAPHTKAQDAEVTEQMEQPQIQYGLTILKKDDQQDNTAEEEVAPAEPMEDVQDNLTEEQRLEKKALDALINGKPTDDALVIPLHNEEDTFQSDLRSAPDAPTLDAYEATPIEGFGAALLRGMGWKDGDAGKNGAPAKVKQVKPRPALLGIGAKEDAAAGVELGDFKGNRGKGRKMQQSYNPVALRNKKTGEVITEDELKAKLEQQDMVTEESRERSGRDDGERRRDKERDRRREDDDGDRRRKDKYRDEEYDSERRREKRRDRDDHYDSERRREKRRDRDDDYDSERRREKRRDDDYDSERRRDKRRERTRSPSDKKRDRYRSRSRDSKRERDRDRRDRSRDSRRRRDYDDERDDRKRRH